MLTDLTSALILLNNSEISKSDVFTNNSIFNDTLVHKNTSNNQENILICDDLTSLLFSYKENETYLISRSPSYTKKAISSFSLTGYSDPIVAEADVSINNSEMIIDIMLINLTKKIMQGVQLEIYGSGDVSFSDKMSPQTLLPFVPFYHKIHVKVK